MRSPSIASGNHTCNTICADLLIDPTNKKKQIKFKIENLKFKNKKYLLKKKVLNALNLRNLKF